ncbi:Tigger transposable element-derived protein 6 [Dictyocoela muelleri]|nr:Tigger transposable element-derived protein 6 [Dictyocoela muelleri]
MTFSIKLKPLIIVESMNPRAFKNFNKPFLCDYMSNVTTWVRTEEFNRRLYDLNMAFKLKNKKILLISDNCLSHKVKIELTNVEIVNQPRNSTSRLKPLITVIIRSFKAKFFA